MPRKPSVSQRIRAAGKANPAGFYRRSSEQKDAPTSPTREGAITCLMEDDAQAEAARLLKEWGESTQNFIIVRMQLAQLRGDAAEVEHWRKVRQALRELGVA